MDTTQFGTYHLADLPEEYEIARGNDFEFIVTGVDNILRAGADESDDNARITNAQEVLYFSVASVSVPHFTQEAISVNRGNSTMKFAGKPSFGDLNLVVNEYIGADTKSALMAWQRLSGDILNDAVGSAADYKKTCYLVERDPSYKLVRTWKLINCWVSGISEGEYSYDDTGKKTISATIAYDRAIPEV